MPRLPRHYLNGELEAELDAARRVEKSRLPLAFVKVIEARGPKNGEPLDHMQHLVYVTTVHVADMKAAKSVNREATVVVYPSDVARLLGVADSRAVGIMGELKRAGLLEGSAAAGYRPTGLD